MTKKKHLTVFIVAGRTGNTLIVSKVTPFALLESIGEIYIFSEYAGSPVEKCRYIIIPDFIRRIRPKIISRLLRFFYEPGQLLFYSLKIKPDILNGIYCLPKGLNAFIVSRLTGVKCVNSVIGSVLEIETELPFKPIWKNINLWQLKRCDAVTVKGERDIDFLVKSGVDQKRLFLFNGAIDTKKFAYNNSERHIDILFVGSFIELKGTDRIIRITAKLKPEYPELKVVMIGDGKLLNMAKENSERLKLNNTISFLGYQPDTLPFFQDSKILLMPSRSDSLPTSMLEAMATGCVPVISDVGNVTEAAVDGVNSRVIKDFMDIETFADAIRTLLNDDNLRTNYALMGRRTVEVKYSIESQAVLAQQVISYLKED